MNLHVVLDTVSEPDVVGIVTAWLVMMRIMTPSKKQQPALI